MILATHALLLYITGILTEQTAIDKYNENELSIRPSTPDDAESMATIFADNYLSYVHPDPILAVEYGATAENIRDFIKTSLQVRKGPDYWATYPESPGQIAYVATVNDVVVGYVAGNQVAGTLEKEPRVAELHDIEVAAAARRHNIGSYLLDTLVEHHESLGRLATFACFVEWAECRFFYEQYGAVMLGPLSTVKTGPAVAHGINLQIEGLVIFGPHAPTDATLRQQLHAEVEQHLY